MFEVKPCTRCGWMKETYNPVTQETVCGHCHTPKRERVAVKVTITSSRPNGGDGRGWFGIRLPTRAKRVLN